MNVIAQIALERGVHESCLKAGPDAACGTCYDLMMKIYSERYDDVPPDRVRTVIAIDEVSGY